VSDAGEIRARLELAKALAHECGELVLGHFQRGVAAELKQDGSPVTVADRECERLIRERVAQQCPEDGVLGEEFGEAPGRSGFRWIIDPIDGTKTFVAGVPLWGTLIGIEHQGRCVAGVAGYPALAEVLWGSQGEGAWHQVRGQEPRPARVSNAPALKDSLLCFTSAPAFERRGDWGALRELCTACRTARGWGDCYGWLLVATGRAEVMLDTHVKPWDLAAFAAILPEAGGVLTDWAGRPGISTGEGIGTTARLLPEVVRIIENSKIPY
jgi:histidinol-phosphatase